MNKKTMWVIVAFMVVAVIVSFKPGLNRGDSAQRVTFRTNVYTGTLTNYGSGNTPITTDGKPAWIAIDRNNDGILESYGFNRQLIRWFYCDDSYHSLFIDTPDGFRIKVRDVQGSAIYVCDDSHMSPYEYSVDIEGTNPELSVYPTEPYSSNGQEGYGEPMTICGNGICEATETRSNCQSDCTCGNGICESYESASNCDKDCQSIPPSEYCGDGICQSNEDSTTCSDCPVPLPSYGICGNNICEYGENVSCQSDCVVQPSQENTSSIINVTSSGNQTNGQTNQQTLTTPQVTIPPTCQSGYTYNQNSQSCQQEQKKIITDVSVKCNGAYDPTTNICTEVLSIRPICLEGYSFDDASGRCVQQSIISSFSWVFVLVGSIVIYLVAKRKKRG